MLDFLCPRLYNLDRNDSRWGKIDDEGVTFPDRLPLSGAALSHDSLYLMTGPGG